MRCKQYLSYENARGEYYKDPRVIEHFKLNALFNGRTAEDHWNIIWNKYEDQGHVYCFSDPLYDSCEYCKSKHDDAEWRKKWIKD